MANYLVTGGAGFIGSHIAEALLRKGHRVTVADDLSNGKMENVEFLRSLGGSLIWLRGDISDAEVAAEAVRDVEIIFHEAALGSVPRSVEDPAAFHRANVLGTLQILMAARNARVRRVVNAASSSAYGDTPELPKKESMPPNPLSPYAATKLAQENYCRAFSVSYDLETVSLRYFNVYGTRQDPNSQYAAVIPRFFQAYLRGQCPEIYGDGEQTRDFTYVEDVVQANLKAAEFPGAQGRVFNIAGGKAVTINELARQIARLLKCEGKPVYLSPRTGDIRHSLADVRLAREYLGWVPQVALDQGLSVSADWYRGFLK